MAMVNRHSLFPVQLPHRSSQEQQQQQQQQQQLYDSDKYRMMVLRFDPGTTEEEVDRRFLQTALNLGINIPQDPKTTLDLVTSNVSALDLTSVPSDPQPPLSSTSTSTHPTSCSSSEQRGHTKSSSEATSSLTSAPSSINSSSSRNSSYVKLKKGIRRLSTLRRRKTIDTPVPPIPIPLAAIRTIRPVPLNRPATTDQVPRISFPIKPVAPPRPPPPTPIRSLGVDQTAYAATKGGPEDDPSARHRSIHHPRLKSLRHGELEEQNRFIRFEADQHRLMRFKQAETQRTALEEHRRKEKAVQERHAEALASLEHRQLSAEVDLRRTLQSERQACDTRLKHMQAFCNPRSTVEGMPSRVVTKQHYRQLEQQYHIRNGMDNLHESRINVLREKQGKQVERVLAKQESETEDLDSILERRKAELRGSFELEEKLLRREFEERKRRLVKRWRLTEAIERRDSSRGIEDVVDGKGGGGGRRGTEVDDFARDTIMAYDAATLNMI
ncbi:MAG: hypothetical protein Q9190_005057 [Brigantiaea leucoxantha]